MICDCLTKKVGQSKAPARQTVRRILTREGTKFRHFDEWFRCVLDIQRTWYDNAKDLCNQGFFPRLSYSFSKSPKDKNKDNPGGGGAKRKGNPETRHGLSLRKERRGSCAGLTCVPSKTHCLGKHTARPKGSTSL